MAPTEFDDRRVYISESEFIWVSSNTAKILQNMRKIAGSFGKKSVDIYCLVIALSKDGEVERYLYNHRISVDTVVRAMTQELGIGGRNIEDIESIEISRSVAIILRGAQKYAIGAHSQGYRENEETRSIDILYSAIQKRTPRPTRDILSRCGVTNAVMDKYWIRLYSSDSRPNGSVGPVHEVDRATNIRSPAAVVIQCGAIVDLIDDKLLILDLERPNSKKGIDTIAAATAELTAMRAVVNQLALEIGRVSAGRADEQEIETAANALRDLLIRYMDRKGEQALHWTIGASIISLVTVLGHMCGVAEILATGVTVMVGGAPVIKGLKAMGKAAHRGDHIPE